MFTSLLFLLPLLALPALALDDNAMRQRSVYQLVTDRFALPNNGTAACDASEAKYCGGTWQAIIGHLDYIKGMGFDTVWISPVVENIGGNTSIGEAYHGYWTLNPANLNSHFGTADDLKSLAAALHDRDMYLQVDVVVNHVAATSGQSFQPSSSYGAFSTIDDYHPFCWVQDYTNQTEVEQCWLGDSNVALADLDTENTKVINYWNDWIKKLISDYSIDTIRIDTVKHVPHTFWSQFINNVNVFNQGEVLDADPQYIASYQKEGSVNPFNYAVYYPVTFTFNSTSFSMDQLIGMVDQVKGNFTDPTLLGSFLNNHDNPRFESHQSDKAVSCYGQSLNVRELIPDDQKRACLPNGHGRYPICLLRFRVSEAYRTASGLLTIRQGFSGGSDPMNREALWTSNYDTESDMYKFFTSLNAARAAAGAASSSFYTNQMSLTGMTSNEVLIAKPPLISLLSNRGSSASSPDITIPVASTQWAPNTAIIDAISCNTFTTNAGGDLVLKVENGLPRVLIEDSKKGKVCESSSASTPGSTGSGGDSSKPANAAGQQAPVSFTTLAGLVGLVAFGAQAMF